MAHWGHKIALKQFLTQKTDDSSVEEVARNFISVLKPFANMLNERENRIFAVVDLEDIIYDFESVLNDTFDEPKVDVFNDIFENLYDWADANRVWIS